MKTIWSHTITNDPNDCSIIVIGTSNKEIALQSAKDLFKKDVTDYNGCVAHSWDAEYFQTEFPDRVFVSMHNVG